MTPDVIVEWSLAVMGASLAAVCVIGALALALNAFRKDRWRR